MNKEEYYIQDDVSFGEMKLYLKEDAESIHIDKNKIHTPEYIFELDSKYKSYIKELTNDYDGEYGNSLIFGKDTTEGIVAVEVKDETTYLFLNTGEVIEKPFVYWILSERPYLKKSKFKKLKGNQSFKYIAKFTDKDEWNKYKAVGKKMTEIYTVNNEREAAMAYYGFTQFKGLKVEDVSVLAFDIESEGLVRNNESMVYVITNTFKKNNETIKKQFRLDHYEDVGVMIDDWCKWVREIDPDVITGHNIYGYDLDYLDHVAGLYDKRLFLGRDGSYMKQNPWSSKYRVDGVQTWEYQKCFIFGRHIIDGMFLAVKYDIGRNYPSWGLKAIAEYEGISANNRQYYDASKIGKNWGNLEEREKIIKYCEDDGDESLALYELMIPSYFYLCQSIPKPFQTVINSASGSWLNMIMVRGYLQEGYSIPKTTELTRVAGGMSYGIPGNYKNVSKWDAASYYPSTILAFDIYDERKDPKANYLKMVKYFTEQRFYNKRKYKETKEKYYDDVQASQKIFINSAYGLLGTTGLNFNSPENASLITKCCRKGLQKAIIWATGKDVSYWWEDYSEEQDFNDFSFIDSKSEWSINEMPKHNWKLVNLDTDSLSFCKMDESEFTEKDYDIINKEINKIMYSAWEDDGMFDKVLVLKAKNYCLLPKGKDKIKKKGSSITDSKKEPALLEMLDTLIEDLIYDKKKTLDIYNNYIKEAYNIKDISRWVTKKTVSKAVLNPTRTNEQKVLDALGNRPVQEGDKVYLYSAIDGETVKMAKGEPVVLKSTGKPKMVPNRILKLQEEWSNDEDKMHYVERVWKTLDIMKNVLDMDKFTKYHLKRNQELLTNL